MRLALLLASLIVLPLALADGWYYAGDTFTEDGVVYSVEGSDHESVLFGVGGRLYLIPLYECKQEGTNEYCYTDTAYPSDEDHIKYEAGERYFGYYITIASAEPSISVTRELSEDEPKLGEDVKVTVTVKNDGDYSVKKLVYEEPIPSGLKVVSGPVSAGKVRWTHNSLPVSSQERFTYTLRPERAGTFEIEPTMTYEFEGKQFNESVSAKEIEVEIPLKVQRNLTKDLSLDETGRYTVNLTNDDEHDPLDVGLTVTIPKGILVKQAKNLVKGDGVYTAKVDLDPEETWEGWFEFIATQGGSIPIPLSVELELGGAPVTLNYSDAVSSSDDRLTPTISLSSKKDVYYAGTELTISGVLENQNDEVKFKVIEGTLQSPLFRDVSFSHESFPAGKKLTEATVRVTLPEVNESTSFPVTFTGSYRSPGDRIFEFEAKEEIAVIPKTHAVEVTRALDPAAPRPGQNVTVTITVSNVYGQYITFDAHEKYPGGFVKTGGLTFTQASLETGASKQVYIYQLEIPVNYSKDRFNLTTSVKVKDLPLPEEYTSEVLLEGATPSSQVDQTSPEDAPPLEENGEPEEEELGFFAAIWDFFKRLLS